MPRHKLIAEAVLYALAQQFLGRRALPYLGLDFTPSDGLHLVWSPR